MNKENKNTCNTDSSTTIDTLQHNVKTSEQLSLKLSFLEYLKQQYMKENHKTKETDKLKSYEIQEELFKRKDQWNFLKNLQNTPIEMEAEEATRKPKKTNIFKEVFRIKSKEPVNEEVDGFVWVEDPQAFKKDSVRKSIKKYFQNPQLNKEKPKDGEDYMFEDFVLVEPDYDEELQINNKFKQGLIDLIAGSLGGIAQVYVSQPLDTVKVKQQTFPKLYGNMFKCFLHTYRKDGLFRGLYAGTLPAVIASVVENSVLFAAYGACQDFIAFVMDIDKVGELSALGNACAGFLAAFFSSFTLCPTELVKCKLQAVHEMKHYVAKDSKATPITAFKLTKDIYITEGISGFYRGLSSTFVREMPGFFFFFGGYEATREYFTESGQSKEDIGPLKTMCAGAVGGITLWTTTFPADVIKSRIQINNLKGSMLAVGSDILRKEGISALYNGLLPSVLRTIPATATLFLVYEYTKQVLGNKL